MEERDKPVKSFYERKWGDSYEEWKKLDKELNQAVINFGIEEIKFAIERRKIALDLLKQGKDPKEATDIARERRQNKKVD